MRMVLFVRPTREAIPDILDLGEHRRSGIFLGLRCLLSVEAVDSQMSGRRPNERRRD